MTRHATSCDSPAHRHHARRTRAAEGITHRLYVVKEEDKQRALLALLDQELGSTLVFTRRKIDAEWLSPCSSARAIRWRASTPTSVAEQARRGAEEASARASTASSSPPTSPAAASTSPASSTSSTSTSPRTSRTTSTAPAAPPAARRRHRLHDRHLAGPRAGARHRGGPRPDPAALRGAGRRALRREGEGGRQAPPSLTTARRAVARRA